MATSNIDNTNIAVVWLYLKAFCSATIADRILEKDDVDYIGELGEMNDVEFVARVDRERLRHLAWLVNDFTEDYTFEKWMFNGW